MNESAFRFWFDRTLPLGLEDGAFVVGVPNDFAREWIDKRFAALVAEALGQVLGDTVTVRVVVDERAAALPQAPAAATPVARSPPRRHAGPRPSRHRTRQPARSTCARTQPPLRLRALRGRPPQPVRHGGGAQRGRIARHRLQPGVHLRGHGPRQDPPHAGRGPRRPRNTPTCRCATSPASASQTTSSAA